MTPEQICDSLNNLLRKHGIQAGKILDLGNTNTVQIGCEHCDCSRWFMVTMPDRFELVAQKTIEMLTDAGYEVRRQTWAHLGEEGAKLIYITAEY